MELLPAPVAPTKVPAGYDERVTERGSTFSAGQRQLISFPRVPLSRMRPLCMTMILSACWMVESLWATMMVAGRHL